MARLPRVLLVPVGIVVAASCGGSAFTTGGGADGGADSTSSPADGSGDTVIVGIGDATASESGEASPGEAGGEGSTSDATVSDGSANEGGGADVSSEKSADASVPDAPADVAEEPPPPTCGGTSACVPGVPPGWSGPVELYAGSSPAPPCTADFTSAYDGNDKLNAPPDTCSCTCDPSITQCAAPTLTLYSAVCISGGAGCTCTGTGCYTTTLQPGACTTVDGRTACGTLGSPAMSAPASAIVGGSCPPKPGKQSVPTSWGIYAQACSSTVTIAPVDCPFGSVCAPKPAAPYGATLCIAQAGDLSCPTQGYTSKHTFYGSVDDQRGCTACSCASPTGASCAATFTTFATADGSCGGGPGISYAAPFSCDLLNQPTDLRLAISSQNGSCVASSVSASGAAMPVSPTTFCCLP